MSDLFFKKCLNWFDNKIDKNSIIKVIDEHEKGWDREVYLVVWNDDDGYTHTYLIRIWSIDDGKTISLSQDYENCSEIESYVKVIPEIVNEINRLR